MAFFVHSWVMVVLAGLLALAGGSCDRKPDAVSCAHTVRATSPALACARCCLELGRLEYHYAGVEPRECKCD
jgi:hypothetical protein